ncbi:MAG: hypothetical protein B7Z37_21055 [Verrucomicrobia bacterium 12-59-8]|nr:MAG: hypothetical protein B7Z37_21055 [Verrucomicrobia bacterium 12-59-8]
MTALAGQAHAQAPLASGQPISSTESSEQDLPAAPPGQLPTGSVGGMGDVNLFPKRIVLSDRERTATVGLYNRAAASGDYDISVNEMVMSQDGRLTDLATVSDPAERERVRTATSFLKWSPRRVTLPANEAQMVRIMARIPADLPHGEYRSHFLAVSVPPETGDLSIENAIDPGPGGVGVRIMPRFGISIPIIVRVGETSLVTQLEDLAVVQRPDGAQVATLTVTRQGTRSAFGDIMVTAPGSKKPIGEIKGVGIYTEISRRNVQIPLDPKADPRLFAKGAKLTVSYIDDDYAPGKTLARQEFTVP